MKSRIIFILVLLLILFILVTRSNHTLQDTILGFITPIKQNYKNLTRSVKDRGKSYIFQKENIQKLTKENKILRKYLLDQTHYLQQVSALYKKIPSLEKLPHHSMELVNTISYIRLNSFNEIMLTRPKKADLEPDHLYGLIQNDVVGGTAILRGDNLYGYLTSNARCRFGVFVGKSRSPGIAEGLDKDTMVVKFIPKWAKIDVKDKVETSGLDGVFFANVPVGVVQKIKIENSYKTAYIKTYNDTRHPDYFFLISDTTPYLASAYDKDGTHFEENLSTESTASPDSQTEAKISSIPKAVQTQDTVVDPTEFEIPVEQEAVRTPKPPVVLRHPKPKKHKKTPPVVKPPVAASETPDVSKKPPTQTQNPKPRKRPSAMDIINGRGF
jgi:rod shape-determining protein MreC